MFLNLNLRVLTQEWTLLICVLKRLYRTQVSSKKEEKKPAEKDGKESAKKQESKIAKSDTPSSSSASDPKKDEKKHGRKFTSFHLLLESLVCVCAAVS